MLLRFDPFRDLDRVTESWIRPHALPMDAYQRGDEIIMHFDLPGVSAESIDLTVEKGVLTVSADRTWWPADEDQLLARERPQGQMSRRVLLGDNLDDAHVEADYVDGVLTVRIPVAERAKPRKVSVAAGNRDTEILSATG